MSSSGHARFRGKLGGNVGGVGAAVKSGVLYPGLLRIGSAFALPTPIFSTNRRQIVTLGVRQRRN
ncbi:MAG TPA: hypothetical protein VGD44_03475 [Phenylobacterium sp.]